MFKLIGHKANPANSFSCDAFVIDMGSSYKISYNVQSYKSHVNPDFFKDYKLNKGLWNFDVCEAFLTHDHSYYLEIQSSPLDQVFSYLIERPREKYYCPNNLNLSTYNLVAEDQWKCEMTISKEDIPGEGPLMGNLFVVLREGEKRCYFALNVNLDESADFHRPDLFRKLL